MSIQPSPRHGGKEWVGGDLITFGQDLRSDARLALNFDDLTEIMETAGQVCEMIGEAVADVHRWSASAWRSRDGGHDHTMGYYDALVDVLDRIRDVTITLPHAMCAERLHRNELDEADAEMGLR